MDGNSNCPVCNKVFSLKEIERHVNSCLFLNSRNETPATTPKRKRENNDDESPKSTKQIKPLAITTPPTNRVEQVICNTFVENIQYSRASKKWKLIPARK